MIRYGADPCRFGLASAGRRRSNAENQRRLDGERPGLPLQTDLPQRHQDPLKGDRMGGAGPFAPDGEKREQYRLSDTAAVACAFQGIEYRRVREIAGLIESSSSHPLARAFAAPDGVTPEVQVVAGQGLEADIGGRRWRLGKVASSCFSRRDAMLPWPSPRTRTIRR